MIDMCRDTGATATDRQERRLATQPRLDQAGDISGIINTPECAGPSCASCRSIMRPWPDSSSAHVERTQACNTADVLGRLTDIQLDGGALEHAASHECVPVVCADVRTYVLQSAHRRSASAQHAVWTSLKHCSTIIAFPEPLLWAVAQRASCAYMPQKWPGRSAGLGVRWLPTGCSNTGQIQASSYSPCSVGACGRGQARIALACAAVTDMYGRHRQHGRPADK